MTDNALIESLVARVHILEGMVDDMNALITGLYRNTERLLYVEQDEGLLSQERNRLQLEKVPFTQQCPQCRAEVRIVHPNTRFEIQFCEECDRWSFQT